MNKALKILIVIKSDFLNRMRCAIVEYIAKAEILPKSIQKFKENNYVYKILSYFGKFEKSLLPVREKIF